MTLFVTEINPCAIQGSVAVPQSRTWPLSEFVKRAYIPAEDLDALVYLWCKSYAHSPYGRARGAHLDHTPGELAYWADQEPVVKRLLSSACVEVACDPDRSRSSPAGPAVIWGFAATSGDTVHYVCVKRNVARVPGLGAEIVRSLLGDRLDRACGYTHDLVEMRGSGACGVMLPRSWYSDSTQIARMLLGPRKAA